jgi:hypothetical protein
MPSSDGHVRFRLLTENDLATGARLVHQAFAPRTVARAELPEIWLRLLRAEQLLGGVIADHAGGKHEIVAFSAAVFVAERFVDEVLGAPRPFLAAHVYEAIRAGRSPVLDLEGVRRANSGDGLNLVILHYGQTDWNLANPRTRAILKAGHTGFPLVFDGYQLNRILEEVFPDQLAAKLAAGFLIKSTYGRDVEPGRGDAPVLVGLFRDDPASRLPGSTAASAFHYRPPRFFFSPSEQRLLGRAAFDDADDRAIAERLDVSTDAIRQTWRRIYSRVAAVDVSVLGINVLSDGRFGTRGPEKRRHLLEYLRFHPEELRPSLKRSSLPSSGLGETMRSARVSRAGR